MRRRALRGGAVALAAAGCIALAAPAAATAAGTAPQWQPFRSSPTHTAAGDPCPFPVSTTPVRDEEEFRVLATHPDGSAALEEFRGALFVRYTNDSTGRSVIRDLSGRAFFRFGSDGTFSGLFLDNGGVTVHAGNNGFPVGEWVFSGRFRVTIDAAGSRQIDLFHASAENICDTLA